MGVCDRVVPGDRWIVPSIGHWDSQSLAFGAYALLCKAATDLKA